MQNIGGRNRWQQKQKKKKMNRAPARRKGRVSKKELYAPSKKAYNRSNKRQDYQSNNKLRSSKISLKKKAYPMKEAKYAPRKKMAYKSKRKMMKAPMEERMYSKASYQKRAPMKKQAYYSKSRSKMASKPQMLSKQSYDSFEEETFKLPIVKKSSQKVKFECNKGHRLDFYGKLPQPYFGYYNCDQCSGQSLEIKKGVWHCSKGCSYDVCQSCLPSKLKCNQGHPLIYLEEFESPVKEQYLGWFYCDKTGVKGKVSNGVWHCALGCSYDLTPAYVATMSKQNSQKAQMIEEQEEDLKQAWGEDDEEEDDYMSPSDDSSQEDEEEMKQMQEEQEEQQAQQEIKKQEQNEYMQNQMWNCQQQMQRKQQQIQKPKQNLSQINARLTVDDNFHIPQLVISEISAKSIIFKVDQGDQKFLNFELESKEKRSSAPFKTLDVSENLIFFIGNLKSMTEYFFRLRGKFNDRYVTRWSKEILVRTIKSHPFSMLLNDPFTLQGYTNQTKGRLNQYKIPALFQFFGIESVNILILGNVGVGKSCFLNSLKTSLSLKFCEYQTSLSGGQQTTNHLTKICMNKFQTINVWDCFAVTEKDGFEIKDGLMKGRIKDGYKKGDPYHFRKKTTMKDFVHSVLLLFSYDDLNNPEKIAYFKELYYNITGAYEIQPIVLVTKIDKVKKHEPLTIEEILDSGPIQAALQKFNEKIPEIPKGIVFPHFNFKGHNDYPNMGLEAIQLIIFEVAVNQAEIYLRRKIRNPMQVTSSKGKVLDIVYTNSIDLSLSEYKQSERLERFVKEFGKRFYFVDPHDRPVPYELEETTYLSGIARGKETSELKELRIQFQKGFEPDHKKLKEMEEGILEDSEEEEEDEKQFLQVFNLSKSTTEPVGFVFFTKTQTIEELRHIIQAKQVLPKGSIYSLFTQDIVKVEHEMEESTLIKDVAFKVMKEHLKIYVKSKAGALLFKCGNTTLHQMPIKRKNIVKTLKTLRKYLEVCDEVLGKVIHEYKFLYRGLKMSEIQENKFRVDQICTREQKEGQEYLVVNICKIYEE